MFFLFFRILQHRKRQPVLCGWDEPIDGVCDILIYYHFLGSERHGIGSNITRGEIQHNTTTQKKKRERVVAIISGAAISLGVNTSCPAIFTRNSAKKRRDATRLLPFSMRQNGQGMSHPERRLSIKAH